MKVCTKCERPKEHSDFYIKSYGLQSWCKSCCSKYAKYYKLENKDKLRRSNFKRKLRSLYNLSEEELLNMKVAQNYKCAICEEISDKLQVDHNHKTGIVRGLLCSICNRGLGCFKDNSQILINAAKYLEDTDD